MGWNTFNEVTLMEINVKCMEAQNKKDKNPLTQVQDGIHVTWLRYLRNT